MSDAAPIVTASDLRDATVRAVLHARLDHGGYLLRLQCVEHPRLVVSVRCERRGAPAVRTWFVDHVELRAGDFELAARLLSQPPQPADLEGASHG